MSIQSIQGNKVAPFGCVIELAHAAHVFERKNPAMPYSTALLSGILGLFRVISFLLYQVRVKK